MQLYSYTAPIAGGNDGTDDNADEDSDDYDIREFELPEDEV